MFKSTVVEDVEGLRGLAEAVVGFVLVLVAEARVLC